MRLPSHPRLVVGYLLGPLLPGLEGHIPAILGVLAEGRGVIRKHLAQHRPCPASWSALNPPLSLAAGSGGWRGPSA